MIKERGIVLFPEEIKAFLNHTKTRLTRPVLPQPIRDDDFGMIETIERDGDKWIKQEIVRPGKFQAREIKCPFGKVGDVIWGKEKVSWVSLAENEFNPMSPDHGRHPDNYPVYMMYRCGSNWQDVPWTPARQMPQWASRIQRRIIAIDCYPIQNMTDADAIAEGLPNEREITQYPNKYVDWFGFYWNGRYFKKQELWFNQNPMVWVLRLEDA